MVFHFQYVRHLLSDPVRSRCTFHGLLSVAMRASVNDWRQKKTQALPAQIPSTVQPYLRTMHRPVKPGLQDSGMYRSGQPFPPGPPSLPSPSRPSKVILQRGYREKEGECFQMLRDVIKGHTGEELRTRQEILRKATDLLLTLPMTGGQSEIQASTMIPYETPTRTGPEGTTLAHLGHSCHWPQTWQSDAGFGAATPYHSARFHDQQYHIMSTTQSTSNQSSFPGYGSNYL
ncbi:hypothetical protein HD554DRAFT_461201 [Boletus coccyginus]|nr:hypothetical protein HD554DRAFT_461201 [Boletus coccyginus]